MPAVTKKVKGGYKCYSHRGKGGRALSKEPKSEEDANRQCRAVNRSLKKAGKI